MNGNAFVRAARDLRRALPADTRRVVGRASFEERRVGARDERAIGAEEWKRESLNPKHVAVARLDGESVTRGIGCSERIACAPECDRGDRRQ